MKISVFLSFVLFASALSGQVTLLQENFDTPGLPAGWERIDNDGNTPANDVSEYTDAWIYKEDPLNAGNGTFSSTSFFDPIDRADRWLISPSITLGASGNFISWKGLSSDASFPDSYKVVISTTTSDIVDFTDTLVLIGAESPDWTEYTLDLEEYASETVFIAFVNTTFDGFKLYLDSIHVREQDPLNVTELDNVTISLYPNPATNAVKVQANQTVTALSLFSALGQRVHLIENNATNLIELELSNLPQGIYYVHLKLISGEIIRKKLIKR